MLNKYCSKIIEIGSLILFASMVCLINPFTISFRGGYPFSMVPNSTFYTLLGLDAIGLLLTLIILFYPKIYTKIIFYLYNLTASSLNSDKIKSTSIATIPILIVYFYYYYNIIINNKIIINNLFLNILIIQASINSSIFFILLILLFKSTRWINFTTPVLSFIIAAFIVSDFISITNGGGRITPDMIGLISTESILSLANYLLILKVAILFTTINISTFLIYKFHITIQKRQIAISIALLSLIVYANPSHLFITGITGFLSQNERMKWRINIGEIESNIIDPFHNFISTITKKKEFEITDLNSFLANKNNIIPSINNSTAHENNIKRVVIIMVESFSLNFSKKYNQQLPASITPFIDSLPDSAPSFWTTSSPTTSAIATHFCSHPNAQKTIDLGYPHSVVRKFKNNGWRTVLFQSPYEDYDNGIKRFSDLGFSEHYGAKWQSNNGKEKFISQWGACDRITLDSIVEYLTSHKNEPVFLAALTVDTHFPTGRIDYAGMKYPEEPSWIKNDPAFLLLRSIFRMDYDLNLFVTKMSNKQLLDENTILIITADHSCPPFPQLNSRLGLNNSRFEKIPLIILSGKKLPEIPKNHLGSQLDTAPTLSIFAGIETDPSWWGFGIYQKMDNTRIISYDHNKISILSPEKNKLQQYSDSNLLKLSQTFVYDNDCLKTRAPIGGSIR